MHTLAETRFRIIASCSSLTELPPSVFNGSQCVALIGLDNEARAVPDILFLKEKYKWLRIIVLGEQLGVDELLAMATVGGDAYLLRNELTRDFLLKSLEIILNGGTVVLQGSEHLLRGHASLQVKALSIGSSGDKRSQIPIKGLPTDEQLSNREHTVILRLREGISNKNIARELDIAEATVKIHVKNLLRKIGARNRTQAALWAISRFGPAVRDL